mmetsp:Transcript_45599/g.102333  ORF Transcript_45599/g.102333 Transcript_45599/m.102333 type:complete len:154 (-) Transcript_45599:175-636(-)
MLSRPLGQCMLSPKPCKCVATTSQMLGFDEGEVMLDKEELVMKTVTFSPWIEGISYQVAQQRSRSTSTDSEHWVERLRGDDAHMGSHRIRWRPLEDSVESTPVLRGPDPWHKLPSNESLGSVSTDEGPEENPDPHLEDGEGKDVEKLECTFDV